MECVEAYDAVIVIATAAIAIITLNAIRNDR